MARFGANILELRASARTVDGARLLVMSAQAQAAFEHSDPDAWERLRDCVDQVLAVPVPTIENVGGGGVRCMLAEVPETTM
jgi:hypothetical protein